ncbi:rRNA pseudouridine synthase [Candidatus Saccharibacteria bacterium]|nr:rRNA pseudouridine synthase [Candidatus Saccharibacteria bacterium]
MDNQVRLNKFLASRLGVSRREADELISSGKITVNGAPAITGVKVDKNDEVCYNKKIIPFATEYTYLAFHKPTGYVCSRRAQGATPTLYDLLPPNFRKLKTVGRLDKDTSGLILLTDDGDFAFRLTHPKFHKEKVYEVELDHPLTPLHQQMISDFGIEIGDGVSQFRVIRNEIFPDRKHFTLILAEGRNRQIRRTFSALGYEVAKLHRTEFGPYKLSGLKPGEYAIIKL